MRRGGEHERVRSTSEAGSRRIESKPPREQRQKQSRWRWLGGLGLLTLLGAAWLSSRQPPEKVATGRPAPERPAPQKPRVQRHVNVTLAPTPPPRAKAETELQPETQAQGRSPAASPAGSTPIPMDERVIAVTVVDAQGKRVQNAVVESEDCRFFRRAPEGEVEVVVLEDACTLQAGRRDGALTAWGDPIFVDLSQRLEAQVRLEVPRDRTAGMGLQVVPEEGGILVLRVIPGSPAEKAGVEAGDLLTMVDGVSTAGMGVREFVELGTGPINTQVKLSLVRRSEAGVAGQDLTLTRQFIEDEKR